MARASSGGRVTSKASIRKASMARGRGAGLKRPAAPGGNGGGGATRKASMRKASMARGGGAALKRSAAAEVNGGGEPTVVFFDDIRLVRDLLGDYDANLSLLHDPLPVH